MQEASTELGLFEPPLVHLALIELLAVNPRDRHPNTMALDLEDTQVINQVALDFEVIPDEAAGAVPWV